MHSFDALIFNISEAKIWQCTAICSDFICTEERMGSVAAGLFVELRIVSGEKGEIGFSNGRTISALAG